MVSISPILVLALSIAIMLYLLNLRPTTSTIPVCRLNTGQIPAALQKYGAAYVLDHNISLDNIFTSASLLFQSKDKKQEFNDGALRGFILPGSESGSTLKEEKEGFAYGYEWDEANFSEGQIHNGLEVKNVWPTDYPKSKKQILIQLFDEMIHVSKKIVDEISRDLQIELTPLTNEGEKISLMRVFHYFGVDDKKNSNLIGSSPHTDWGFLTLILQFGTGLEIFNKSGDWLTIHPIPGSLILNGGDYLSILSEGKYISPLHRVVLSDKERLSFVLFFYPNFHTTLKDCRTNPEAELSLLKKQDESMASKHKIKDLINLPFGQFILNKWREVQRY